MEWTRPGTGRHFDFQGEEEADRKRYIITLKVTNNDPEYNIAVIDVPFQQDGWSMVPSDLAEKATVENLKVREREEAWRSYPDLPHLEGEQKGLLFYSHTHRQWGAYLERGQTATITFEALVTCHKPLVEQTITLRYFPDLEWDFDGMKHQWNPRLKPSPFYSSNWELEKRHLA